MTGASRKVAAMRWRNEERRALIVLQKGKGAGKVCWAWLHVACITCM